MINNCIGEYKRALNIMTELDERYRKGKIYTIRNITDDTMIYVGSTITTLSKRLSKHRCDCKNKCSNSLYKNIIENDWTDWYIELYENYPCNNKSELCKREGEVIRDIGNINKSIAGRTRKQWKVDNREHSRMVDKEYRDRNKEKIAELQKVVGKIYRDNNKEIINDKYKKWYDENKSSILEQRKVKVCCEICGFNVSNGWLKEHQKTKKCLEASKS